MQALPPKCSSHKRMAAVAKYFKGEIIVGKDLMVI
jgi:hypothetical protein